MQNWDRVLDLSEQSANSAGQQALMHAKAMEGLDASINTLTNSWQKFLTTLTSSDASYVSGYEPREVNLDYGIKEMSHEEGKSEMQAYCWDLETNTLSSQNFTVEHIMETKQGNRKLTSQRDIYERTANDGARRLRSRILAILPPDLVEDCINECKKTLTGKNDMPLIDKIKNMVTAFEKLGVTKEMLETRLKHTIETVNADELTEYIGIYNGLKQKETTISDWFEQPKTASQLTELLEQEEKGKKKGADK